jgi:peptidoglycan/xylan/chitin deacetylase (PgdA/CDA1 family)
VRLRRFLCATFYYSGLSFVFRLWFRRNDCLVLMYHRIIDPNTLNDLDARFVHPGMYVTKETFEMQMAYIARHFRVIDVAQLMSVLKGREGLPRNACVITFDDGWRDNYTHALPVLKKHSLPATIFLVSDYIGTHRWFWQEKLSFLLSKCLTSPCLAEGWVSSCPTIERRGLAAVLTDKRLTPAAAIRSCLGVMETLAQSDTRTMAKELEAVLVAHRVPVECSERLMLNWEEIGEMSINRIAFGSHTRSHPILTKVAISEAVQEISGSKLDIEAHLPACCSTFCYPNGQFNEDIKRNVMAHYECAFSTNRGFVTSGHDIFALRRIGIHDEGSFTQAMFACTTSGILEPFLSVWRP